MDGNIAGEKTPHSPVVTLRPHEKFRGVPFNPMAFRLDTVRARGLKDSNGKEIPTVVAHPLVEQERKEGKLEAQTELVAKLKSVMQCKPGLSFQAYATEMDVEKRQVQTAMDKMKKQGLVEKRADKHLYLVQGGEGNR